MGNLTKRKIGIFTRAIDQGTSGSGSHLKQILAKIIALNEKFDITLIHYVKNNAEIYSQVNELIIPRNPILASLILRKHKFDLIQYAPLTIFSPIWFLKAKKIAIIHGLEIDLIPHLYNKIKVLHQKYIHPWYARRMDRIFTVSEMSKKNIATVHGVDINKIEITYNAVGDDFIVLADRNKARDLIAEKFEIKSKFILHISKYSLRKNPDIILKSFKELHKAMSSLVLVLAGKDWENPRVVSFVKENKLQDHVVFTGFTKTEDLVLLLNMAEVFIFPSFAEGFGMPNIEAMACGCPVVTSKAFAIPEIVGDAAILLENNEDHIELAKHVSTIITDPEHKNILVERGLRRVKRYSWDASARIALETYGNLLSQ